MGFGTATIVMLAVGWYRGGWTIVDSLLTGVAVFVAWATTRELIPDHPGSASFAMVLALGAAIYAQPSALIAAIALIGVRLVAGTVGAPVGNLDIVALGIIGIASGAIAVLWIVAVAIGAWIWTAPEVGRLRSVAGVVFVVGTGFGIAAAYGLGLTYGRPEAEITATAYVLAATAGAAMLLASRPTTVVSSTDAGGARIDVARIRLARLAAGAFIMWAAVIGGQSGFWSIAPVMASLVATAIYRIFKEPA
jgi:hypothetical protein